MSKVKFNALQYSPSEVADLSLADINRAFRAVDESNKWPICGQFNVTERAIRKIRTLRRQGLDCNSGFEYCLTLERTIGEIVNSL